MHDMIPMTVTLHYNTLPQINYSASAVAGSPAPLSRTNLPPNNPDHHFILKALRT